MAISKKLQRQFRKNFGSAEFDQVLRDAIASLESRSTLDSDLQQALAYYKGFQDFFETVQSSYDQYEKMLGISSRSLHLSSAELNQANRKLKEMNRTVESMLANLGEGLKAAREIQQSLIPPLVQDFGLTRIEALYRPSEELSGDFFDIHQKGKWLYFYLADVTSHGTASAQVTYLIKGIVQDIMFKQPDEVELSSVMEDFCRRYVDYNLKYAAGIQMYRFDTESKILEATTSNAPGPIRVNCGSSQFIPTSPGPLLFSGTFDPNYKHVTESFQLSSSDVVYFFTDGAFDFPMPSKGRDFTERDFAKILQNAPNDGWQTYIVDKLEQAHESRIFPDDVTILRLSMNE